MRAGKLLPRPHRAAPGLLTCWSSSVGARIPAAGGHRPRLCSAPLADAAGRRAERRQNPSRGAIGSGQGSLRPRFLKKYNYYASLSSVKFPTLTNHGPFKPLSLLNH